MQSKPFPLKFFKKIKHPSKQSKQLQPAFLFPFLIFPFPFCLLEFSFYSFGTYFNLINTFLGLIVSIKYLIEQGTEFELDRVSEDWESTSRKNEKRKKNNY